MLPSGPGNKVFFVRAFRAPRQLQRYHDYFSDHMRQSLDTLPIAIIIKEGVLRGKGAKRRRRPRPSGDMTKFNQHPLAKILESRIVIIDGAMGTTIRSYGM